MDKVNLAQKFSLFSDYYSPKIVGELNDFHVKLVKLQGEFVWHHHDVEDELFFVVKGSLKMGLREEGAEREIVIQPGEFIIIPHGVEHCPSADEETHIMLLEPKSTPRASARCGNHSGFSFARPSSLSVRFWAERPAARVRSSSARVPLRLARFRRGAPARSGAGPLRDAGW